MSKFEESNFYKALQDFFINADKKTFLQFLAEFYNRTEGIIDKNNIQDELIKELRELYLEFNGNVSQEDINAAVNNYFTEHPVASGATAEQAAQIEANRTAIQTVNETIGNKNELPVGDVNIIASINRIDNKQFDSVTDEQISTAVNNYLTEHPISITPLSIGAVKLW